jgi:hypothetical protein
MLGLGVPKLAPLGLNGDVLIHVAKLSIARDGMEETRPCNGAPPAVENCSLYVCQHTVHLGRKGL